MMLSHSERARNLLHGMLRIRRFEEKSAELYSAGKIRGFLHLYVGEEAVATGVMQALRPEDAIFATYREHGHALARGLTAASIMAEMFGKAEGCSRGRGGSMHLFDVASKFYGGSAIVGGGLPLAVGYALAQKMQQRPGLVACFFGEGAIAEGEFHESLNLAALWKVPVLFLCENNYYAMGTALERSEAEVDLVGKAAGYRVQGESVDGMDVLAVLEATQQAVQFVREHNVPYFLEFRTYRFRAHSMFDPELYRSKAEVEQWKQRCPIAGFSACALREGWLTPEAIHVIEDEVAQEIAHAVEFAEAGTWEPTEMLSRDVYTERKGTGTVP
ncbi:pyruvate dehydrogenase (acetyl-transferring) E1 component subunit alpha [Candidatus Nitrotoga fabula]|uniref:Pyruvate dehydrogenase E1 component subunit alpha n=1 Tax=Candidatus Nitrotoga fabula TaxID=2182327 RepID=A0A916F8F9_9PROT|nr:pyruvate dehydrogenase (acetyl-transferring) E1 component subunit alpha [Candidatus Nitrotoga fabula]CAE6701352.1 Pyruvate dehydrogenase E1 component subunit alpha [Candidatus Nitrotoga fabula]